MYVVCYMLRCNFVRKKGFVMKIELDLTNEQYSYLIKLLDDKGDDLFSDKEEQNEEFVIVDNMLRQITEQYHSQNK